MSDRDFIFGILMMLICMLFYLYCCSCCLRMWFGTGSFLFNDAFGDCNVELLYRRVFRLARLLYWTL